MQVEYELDQWEWQGTTRSVDIDPEDYAGMSATQIKQSVYEEIWRDAVQNLHFVYAEDETAQMILDALSSDERDAESED